MLDITTQYHPAAEPDWMAPVGKWKYAPLLKMLGSAVVSVNDPFVPLVPEDGSTNDIPDVDKTYGTLPPLIVTGAAVVALGAVSNVMVVVVVALPAVTVEAFALPIKTEPAVALDETAPASTTTFPVEKVDPETAPDLMVTAPLV